MNHIVSIKIANLNLQRIKPNWINFADSNQSMLVCDIIKI